MAITVARYLLIRTNTKTGLLAAVIAYDLFIVPLTLAFMLRWYALTALALRRGAFRVMSLHLISFPSLAAAAPIHRSPRP